jgi:uncharacterized protein
MHEELLKAYLAQQPFPLLFATLDGAHLYGYPSFDSDYDLRGAHILPLENVIGLYTEQETIETKVERGGVEIDLTTHDIKKVFDLILKRNGFILEQIFSPIVYHSTPGFEELKAITANCITKNHGHHYRSMAQKLWAHFERQRRLKPLLFVYRLLLTGIYLMESGKVEANLMRLNHHYRLPYLGDLISLKLQGSEETLMEDVSMAFHEREYRRLLRQLDDARISSELPEEPRDKPALHSLLVRLRMEYSGL